MKFTYPAVIGKEENGSWKAVLPDLACCEAEYLLRAKAQKKHLPSRLMRQRQATLMRLTRF